MPASAALPGLVFCLSAAVLLTFVSVSAPTWDKIYFLDAGSGSSVIHFGVFGRSGSHISIGYRFNSSALNFNDDSLNTPVFANLTKALILHPIGHGRYVGLCVLFGLCGASYHRAGTVGMVLLAALTSVLCLLAFLFDMVLFGIVRNKFRDQGIPSQYGNACWLTLAGLIALLLGLSTAVCGSSGRSALSAT
ncbi:pali-domain-containing protein [Mycena sp. CBHHK59/15]|nr:pali-domain-containing protein [Mycena sp. CBHHK59/15]